MARGVKLGTKRGKYAIQPTNRQQKAVQGFLDGKKWIEALKLAGYSHKTSNHFSKKEFLNSSGAQEYAKQLDEESRQRFGISLPDKVMEAFFEGTDATKMVRVSDNKYKEYPDWMTRKAYLDRFAQFFGWI